MMIMSASRGRTPGAIEVDGAWPTRRLVSADVLRLTHGAPPLHRGSN